MVYNVANIHRTTIQTRGGGRMSQHLWTWEASRFEKIENERVKAEPTEMTWDVMLEVPDLAWGYCIALPDEARSYILWRSRLEVQHVLGDISPGIAYHDGVHGVVFQLDTLRQKAELRYLLVAEATVRTETFDIATVRYPLDLMLEYNAVTNKCVALINTDTVFEVKLPYKNVPLLATITSIEIMTSTPANESGGTVGYGDLSLHCE